MQKLKRLQSCDGVPHLVEGGIGKHHGRSYVVMELFAEDNLAVFQQKALLDAAAIRSIGQQHLMASLHLSPACHTGIIYTGVLPSAVPFFALCSGHCFAYHTSRSWRECSGIIA